MSPAILDSAGSHYRAGIHAPSTRSQSHTQLRMPTTLVVNSEASQSSAPAAPFPSRAVWAECECCS